MHPSVLSRRRAPAPDSGHPARPIPRPELPSSRHPRSSTAGYLVAYHAERSDRADCRASHSPAGAASPEIGMTRYYSREAELASSFWPPPRGPADYWQSLRGSPRQMHCRPVSESPLVLRLRPRAPGTDPTSGSRGQMPACSNCSRISRCGGRVGNTRTRSDGGEIIPDHIRYHVSADFGRCQGPSQLATAPAGEPLTNSIHRRDVEA